MFCDVYEEKRNNLVEAKGSCSRESVRMAIGQLADYGRFETSRPARAVLLPERPRQDLEELLRSVGVFCRVEGLQEQIPGQRGGSVRVEGWPAR
jgi:hypothetical protein